jgi:hypothetical protein
VDGAVGKWAVAVDVGVARVSGSRSSAVALVWSRWSSSLVIGRSCGFMECANGGLVVGLGGGGVVHSILSGMRPVEGRVVGFI